MGDLHSIQEVVRLSGRKIVVLDDDPTGVQTVHGVAVLTSWEEDAIQGAFLDPRPLFFILTNTRSYEESSAASINREIAEVLAAVSARTGIPFTIISRGDSTLRGHFPLETDVLGEVLEKHGMPVDGVILLPAFFEGGRTTEGDVHYLQDNGARLPVHLTEFARDPAFGYAAESLPAYVEEKTGGRVRADEVISISLEQIRSGGPERVRSILSGVKDRQVVVVNSACYRDMELFTLGLLTAEQEGKRFLFRTAASFVKVRGGIPDKPLLSADDMVSKDAAGQGGVILVGSHVSKTTRQLQKLLEGIETLKGLEMDVAKLLAPEEREMELDRIVRALNEQVVAGIHSVVYTSRKVITVENKMGNLSISQSVSEAMVEVVRRLVSKPAFVIAKGGITSSDIATKGLGIRAAEVLGQAAKGVPVWRCGTESKFPGMAYVVFPGNVGTDETLRDVAQQCTGIGETLL